jgi:hypothetical protein
MSLDVITVMLFIKKPLAMASKRLCKPGSLDHPY